MAKPKTPAIHLKLPFMVLVTAFSAPRTDHPGRKSGLPYRRGCYSGKICRDDKKYKGW